MIQSPILLRAARCRPREIFPADEVRVLRIGTIEVNNPVFLAPMAGVTDWAFRTVCAELGAGVTVTEMVSSRALVYRDQKSAKLLRKNPGSVCGAQIFGNDPDTMAEGARLALEIWILLIVTKYQYFL